MSRADCGPAVPFDWEPYERQGARCNVREFVTRGKVEFELCLEGGRDVIRRSDYSGGQPVVTEVGRSLSRLDTLDLWNLIVRGNARRLRL